MSLNIGDKVIVKPLEWFKENYEFNEETNTFYPKSSRKSDVCFTESMQKFCEKLVTIEDIVNFNFNLPNHDIFTTKYYLILEDDSVNYWRGDYFTTSADVDPIKSIKRYCNNFCIIGNRSTCNNSECPLYIYNSCKM